MSAHESHERNVQCMMAMLRAAGPDDHAERERILWNLVSIHAGALTPVSENEKRGMARVLAILDRKMAEGGMISGEGPTVDNHNRFYRGRWSAFQECAMMLRSALEEPTP